MADRQAAVQPPTAFTIFPLRILVIVDREVPANRGPAVPLEHRPILPAWSRRSQDTRSLTRGDALRSSWRGPRTAVIGGASWRIRAGRLAPGKPVHPPPRCA